MYGNIVEQSQAFAAVLLPDSAKITRPGTAIVDDLGGVTSVPVNGGTHACRVAPITTRTAPDVARVAPKATAIVYLAVTAGVRAGDTITVGKRVFNVIEAVTPTATSVQQRVYVTEVAA